MDPLRTLAGGCDSDPYLAEVERFLIADAAAQQDGFRPGTADYDEILDGQEVVRFDQVLMAASNLHQNEHHDCQRLLVEDDAGGWAYGPLVGVFVQPDVLEGPAPGGQVRVEMFNFTGEAYEPLGIDQAGLYCVWMEGEGTQWGESTVFRPRAGTSCQNLDPEHPNAEVTATLFTAAQEIVGPPPASGLARTARWMWDEDQGVQYVGARCGSSWCSLTPTPMTFPQPTVPANQVPGISDSQYLGVLDAEGDLIPSRLVGTIEPLPGVIFANAAAQRNGLIRAGRQGQPSARMTLTGEDPSAREFYAEKLDIDTGPPRARSSVDVIWMRVTPGEDPESPAEDTWEGYAQSRGPDNAHTLEVAVNVPHSGLGTVRWRWFEDDERGWLPCRNGCCTYYSPF